MSQHNETPIKSKLVQDDESFADLVEEFVDGLAKRVSDMSTALQENNLDDLKRFAHQLKGAGGGHGYPVLTEVSAQLEKSAADNELDKCRQSIDELQAIISRVVVQ